MGSEDKYQKIKDINRMLRHRHFDGASEIIANLFTDNILSYLCNRENVSLSEVKNFLSQSSGMSLDKLLSFIDFKGIGVKLYNSNCETRKSVKNLYAKFISWDKDHSSELLSKKHIKFPTVFEFNDFNEFRIFDTDLKETKIDGNLLDDCEKNEFFERRLQEYCDIFGYDNNGSLQLRSDTAAFSSVGISCFSSVDVFRDESAMLMFGHYAGKQSGLCLIFEIKNDIFPVIYKNTTMITATPIKFNNWMSGEFNGNDMEDFLIKSESWSYEQEFRMFGVPGNYPFRPNQGRLLAILHTYKLSDESIKKLEEINSSFYDDSLVIKKIHARRTEGNVGKFFFFDHEKNMKCVYEMLVGLI